MENSRENYSKENYPFNRKYPLKRADFRVGKNRS